MSEVDSRKINVLIPTYRRGAALAVTLTSLCFQMENDFDVMISDQFAGDELTQNNSTQTAIRLLELKGHNVTVVKNIPRRGMAHQRQFLLDRSFHQYSLFLDDDLILEPFVLRNMRKTIEQQQCGFVGCAVVGLSYRNDYRPNEQHLEIWDRVVPETVEPFTTQWERYKLHNAANVLHVQQRIKADPDDPIMYKIAWVGGCTLYDTQKLHEVGGFTFWEKLPEEHAGEDVLVQLRLMKKFGGCGILPTGVYHQELKTTVTNRRVNAPEVIAI